MLLDTFKKFDSLLRGDLGRDPLTNSPTIQFPILQIVCISVLMAVVFGACIAAFTVVGTKDSNDGLMQLVASMVKTPMLFYLTLVVTFPSLYVFSALMGSRLNVLAALQLMIAAITVMVTILASLGPIIVFFAFSTPSGILGYRFILLLIVLLSSGAGILGLNYLLRMLNQYAASDPESRSLYSDRPFDNQPRTSVNPNELTQADSSTSAEHPEGSQELETGPNVWSAHRAAPRFSESNSSTAAIFRVWVFVFAVVGAQMSWVLRPFVGAPGKPFTWFRERDGNFFQSVSNLIWQLFNGN